MEYIEYIELKSFLALNLKTSIQMGLSLVIL